MGKKSFLEAAMKLKASGGMCFHRSVALCLDAPGAHVCIGLFPPASAEERAHNALFSDTPFYHAWVEYRGMLFSPTTIEACGYTLKPFSIEEYYEVNEVTDVRSITRPRILALTKEHGWKNHLLRGDRPKTGVPLAEPLLNEAGFDWGMSANGGVVPIEYARKENQP